VAEHFKIPKEERDRFVRAFLAARDVFGYFTFSPEKRTFLRGDAPSTGNNTGGPPGGEAAASATAAGSVSDVSEEARRTLEEYSGFVCCPEKAMKIFNFLIGEIPVSSLDPKTLMLTLRSKGYSGELVKISLLDYLNALNSQDKPSSDVVRLHLYLSRRVTLPRVFVQNAHLRRLDH
jgi:hypothetical protein